MFLITLVCQWRPEWFILGFTREADVVAVGAPYLRIISWNFVASGLIFTCSGMFQALGNTWPSLLSSASRLFTFVVPVILLSQQPHFTLTQVWYLSVATVSLQAVTSLALLLREFRRKLAAPPAAAGGAAGGALPVGSGSEDG
jgi:Na+-driven multidrug efflux pump